MNRRSMGWGLACCLALVVGCQRPGPMAIADALVDPWQGMGVRTASYSLPVGLTLYADNWAMVTDARSLSLPPGRQVIRFPGIAPKADPDGAYLQVPATVSERRYRYDLASRERLLQRYQGMMVDVYPRGSTTPLEAVLLMTDSGPVYKMGDRLYTDPPGKVALPALDGLATDPTLEWIATRDEAWQGVATASYVVNQLGWQCEYTLVTDEAQDRGEWKQWAAIANHSGQDYANARVTLVTGEVRRARAPRPMMAGGARAYAEAAPGVLAEPYAARYEYRLPSPLTLVKEQEQRLVLRSTEGVPMERTYRVESGVSLFRIPDPEAPRKAQLRLTIQNTEAAGLGVPLPRGKVTVYTPTPQGTLAIAGEAGIPDTPRLQPVVLDLGEAFDVTARRVQTAYQVVPAGREVAYRVTLSNQQSVPVRVEVLEQMGGDWTLLESSEGYERLSQNRLRFTPLVPAHAEVVVTYRARIAKERP